MGQPYHIVRFIVKKLPATWLRFALPMCTAVFMTFLVSGVATWRALGSVPGMVWTWMVSWFIAWLIAAPTMFFMMPLVRRWLLRIIEEPQSGSKNS
jgi:hypothetical protein